MHTTIRIPDDVSEADLQKALGAQLSLGPARSVRLTFLDSFDWILSTDGARLWRESSGGRHQLCWVERPAEPTYSVPIQGDVRWAADLPQGHLRSRIAPHLGIRALTEVGGCRIQRRRGGVRDGDGNNTLLVDLDRAELLGPSGSTVTVIRLVGVPGLERPFKKAVRKLTALGGDAGETADLLELATAAQGRFIGDYSSKLRLSIKPDQPSDEALRNILLTLLKTLRANVAGTIADIDTEFLHDLRVASRRTRSALTQVKGVLPAEDIAPFMTEFKWLGTVTGPCRDLDVLLMEMEEYHDELPELADALKPLLRTIQDAREEAYREVCAGLRSRRFASLVTDWEAYVASETPPDRRPDNAGVPIRETASGRILKAYRRMLKRGGNLGDDPPAEALHQLRIDAKKLRYLLEFFRNLYPKKEIDRLVRELKALQDVLGGLNDMEVQQDRLLGFARDLSSAPEDHAATLIAMGRLSAIMADRQEAYRLEFAERFEVFAHPKSQDRYRSLFGSGA